MKEEAIKKIDKLLSIPKCEDLDYKRKFLKVGLKDDIWYEQEKKCYLCLVATTIPKTHHIKPDGESIRENLVILCSDCHQFIHHMLHTYLGYRKQARGGMWRRRGGLY